MPERHFCCGSAGTYNLLQPEIAATLGQRKAAHVESIDPDIVAAGNLGCMVQIGRYLGRCRWSTPSSCSTGRRAARPAARGAARMRDCRRASPIALEPGAGAGGQPDDIGVMVQAVW